jgi:formamidopyrimidine-DNA glycosylase
VPELPEVETVRQGLNQATLGKMIQGGDVWLERTIAHPFLVSEFLVGITGTSIFQWHRRGKYLLAALVADRTELTAGNDPSGGWLGVHLRMTGQLLWMAEAEPLPKHCRVRLRFPEGKELRFVDQRTFGQMWWVPPGVLPEHDGFSQVGARTLFSRIFG